MSHIKSWCKYTSFSQGISVIQKCYATQQHSDLLCECHFYESNGSRPGLKFILACSLCTDLRPRIAFAKTAGRGEYNSENEEGRQSFRLWPETTQFAKDLLNLTSGDIILWLKSPPWYSCGDIVCDWNPYHGIFNDFAFSPYLWPQRLQTTKMWKHLDKIFTEQIRQIYSRTSTRH